MNSDDYFADIGFWPTGSGLRSYAIGLVLSLLLTLVPFTLLEIHLNAHHETFSHSFLVVAAIMCALLQFLVQVAFFLHLVGRGVSRERLAVFGGACLIVAILVGGSLWIMSDLGGRMTAPPDATQMTEYMQQQDGF